MNRERESENEAKDARRTMMAFDGTKFSSDDRDDGFDRELPVVCLL